MHLDQAQPGYDGTPLLRWLDDYGAPFEILREDTYSMVIELVDEGKSYCGPCSRMRRGILYGVAERLGCNKIALGHHRDDALETLSAQPLLRGQAAGDAGDLHAPTTGASR